MVTARLIVALILIAAGCALMLTAAPRDGDLTATVLVGR